MNRLFHTIPTRIVSVLLLALLPLTSVQGYFSNEVGTANVVSASELALSVGLSQSAGNLGAIMRTFESDFGFEQTEASVQSDVTLAATSIGDGSFCSALTLMLDTGMQSQLAPLDEFVFGPISGTSTLQVVDVRFGLPTNALSGIPHGAGCAVQMEVAGTQSGQSSGFTDSRTLTWQLTAQQVVLNEVLADPATGQVEFIELANVGSTPVDVAGWTMTELTSGGAATVHAVATSSAAASDLVAYDDSGSTIVPAGGQLALKFAGNTSYLNNDGDTITLFDAAGTQLDSYTYTTSLNGKSDARIPDGIGDWIDPIPTPGTPNKLETSLNELSVALAPAGTSTATNESHTTGGDGGGPASADRNASSSATEVIPQIAASSTTQGTSTQSSSTAPAVESDGSASTTASSSDSLSVPLPASTTAATGTEPAFEPATVATDGSPEPTVPEPTATDTTKVLGDEEDTESATKKEESTEPKSEPGPEAEVKEPEEVPEAPEESEPEVEEPPAKPEEETSEPVTEEPAV